jgi:hypothetical protein
VTFLRQTLATTTKRLEGGDVELGLAIGVPVEIVS